MYNCQILPEKIERTSQEKLDDYLKKLYASFNEQFIEKGIKFKGKRINYRKIPKSHGNYEEAFIHITHSKHKNSNGIEDRTIDYSRSSKISWIKPIIENIPCKYNCCDGFKVWKEDKRIHILFEKEKYLIVLEERNSYYLLITAYYLQTKYELNNKLKKYNENKYNTL